MKVKNAAKKVKVTVMRHYKKVIKITRNETKTKQLEQHKEVKHWQKANEYVADVTKHQMQKTKNYSKYIKNLHTMHKIIR